MVRAGGEGMNDAKQATPPAELERQICDPRVFKNEREWWANHEIERLRAELATANRECDVREERERGYLARAQSAEAKLAECERERDALKQQAKIWAQEARTQTATVHEIYRLCTGGKGEPGDWHGEVPVRELVAYIERLETAIRAIIDDLQFSSQGHALDVTLKLRAALEEK